MFILRVRRDGRILEAAPDLVLERDDVVAVVARYEAHVTRGDVIGPEIGDLELLDIPVEALDVVVTNKLLVGEDPGAPGAGTLRPRHLPVEDHPRRHRGADLPGNPRRPRRRPAHHRPPAGGGPRVEGARLRGPQDLGDRHGVRRHGHLPGRARGPAVGRRRERAAHLDGERRRAGDGSRVRLAAVRLPLLRADSRAGHLDLRHARPVHVHRHRRPERRPELRVGPAE